MALTFSTTNPPRRGEVVGQHFTDYFPQTTAGASGNTITLGASRVLNVRITPSPSASTDPWQYAKPTLTIPGLTNTDVYDIEVDYI